MNPSNIYILKIKNAHYCCIISKAINLLQNTDLTEKVGHYNNLLKINIRSNF